MKKKEFETGRSMVEMLGVLAIIGVLSIGGIAGYRFALKKRMANHLLNLINQMAHDISYFFLAHPDEEKNIQAYEELYDFMPAQIQARCGIQTWNKVCAEYYQYFMLILTYSDVEVIKMITQALAQHPLVESITQANNDGTSIIIKVFPDYLDQNITKQPIEPMPQPTPPPEIPNVPTLPPIP